MKGGGSSVSPSLSFLPAPPAPTSTPTSTASAPPGVGDGLIVAPTQPVRGQLLVRVLGEVDLLSADRLQRVLIEGVAALDAERDQTTGPPLLVCDMQGVEFLGASGLAVLARVGVEAAERTVAWTVVATHTAVRRPLEVLGLDDVVSLAGSSPLHRRSVADHAPAA
jgi:anti-sigma B factor antagonist